MPALLDGQPFWADPESVSWTFGVKTRVDNTIGGKVVQVYGIELGLLTVTGSFGRGGWEEQNRFLERMTALADSQIGEAPNLDPPQPHRFFWAEKRWDMLVWLSAYSEPGGGEASVTYTEKMANPRWSLALRIIEDNSGLKQVAEDEYLRRLSEGIGWTQSIFNGPLTENDVREQMAPTGAQTIRDFVHKVLHLGNGNANPVGPTAPTDTPTAGTRYGAGLIAQVAKAAGFAGEDLVTAVAIALGESGGQTDNTNKNTNGSTDYGLWQINSVHSAFDISKLFNPMYNAECAYVLYTNRGQKFTDWVVYKSGRYREFLDQARAGVQQAGG